MATGEIRKIRQDDVISTANMHEYSTLLRVIALFLEEEGRNIDALAAYIRYLHYSSNFNAGLQTLKMNSFNKDLKDATDRLYMYAEMLPFMANDIIRMSNKCGFDSGKPKDFISEILSKEQDTGIFSQQEMVELLTANQSVHLASTNSTTIMNFTIPYPSTEEQKEIVDYLDDKTAKIDQMISGKMNLLSELDSYKKSLIYEYVTGKKEVPA